MKFKTIYLLMALIMMSCDKGQTIEEPLQAASTQKGTYPENEKLSNMFANDRNLTLEFHYIPDYNFTPTVYMSLFTPAGTKGFILFNLPSTNGDWTERRIINEAFLKKVAESHHFDYNQVYLNKLILYSNPANGYNDPLPNTLDYSALNNVETVYIAMYGTWPNPSSMDVTFKYSY